MTRPLLVSKADAAALLSVSVSSFVRHVEPHVRWTYVGSRPMYLVSDLEAWVEDRANPPMAADLARLNGAT